MTDAELDARFAAIAGVEPPGPVAEATLDAWQRLRDDAPRVVPLRRRVLPWAAAAMAMAAGLALVLRSPAPEHGDPAEFVPRGSAEMAPTLDVVAVVGTASGFQRLDPARTWAAGDTVRFRVHVDAPVEVVLSRAGEELWRGPVSAGDTELPVSWAFDPGEGASSFRIDAGGASVELHVAGVTP